MSDPFQSFRLDGKVAIVTGASSGIGEQTAKLFSSVGANVVAAARRIDRLEKLSDETENIVPCACDVTADADCENLVQATLDQFGKVDILINNAGVIRDRSFMKMSEEEWNTVININLTGMFIVTKAVFPIMKEAGYGRIISASSINAFQGAFGQANYSATKAGISGFTRALCKEGGKYGITVNAVAPGFIKSLMSDSMPEEIIKAVKAQKPVGRIVTHE